MKPWIVHYMNKYPRGTVTSDDHSIDVTCAMGKNRVALRKNGAGQWVDQSRDLGYLDRHDLAPIPRDSRVYKLTFDGRIDLDELAVERSAIGEELAAIDVGGCDRVPSIADLALSVNPQAEVRALDTRFEYGKWEHRVRGGRVLPPPAPLPAALQAPVALTKFTPEEQTLAEKLMAQLGISKR